MKDTYELVGMKQEAESQMVTNTYCTISINLAGPMTCYGPAQNLV